jgi:hypothetical protein
MVHLLWILMPKWLPDIRHAIPGKDTLTLIRANFLTSGSKMSTREIGAIAVDRLPAWQEAFTD